MKLSLYVQHQFAKEGEEEEEEEEEEGLKHVAINDE
eukprot:COSAG02_NODE_58762_length_276_cov_0.864407_1_plen_35_part_10